MAQTHPNLQAKWDTFYQSHTESEVAPVLSEHAHLLPLSGYALDLACGNGANAVFLAERGLTVEAWDISEVALNRLTQKAQQYNLSIISKRLDITPQDLVMNSFDVIIVSRFLDRQLIPSLIQALKPEGLLFYQTFTVNKLTSEGPSHPDYLLQRNELLRLFQTLTLVFYQEEDHLGDLTQGNRNQAYFIGQKKRQEKI